jgi:hypothetical protein
MPAWMPPPDVCRIPAGRSETGVPLRQNALDPGFHRVQTAPAHPDLMLLMPV